MSINVAVIGTGYVGLVSGACLADLGNNIFCIDNNKEKISSLKKGDIPIYEPGLDEVIRRNVDAGRLSFSCSIEDSIGKIDAVLIAVGTPTNSKTGEADTSYVFAAVEEIAEKLKKSVVFITKSTVPVGTGKAITKLIKDIRPDLDCCVVSNPEFLREGSAVYDFMNPDRIIVGTEDDIGRELMQKLYQPLVGKGQPLLFTNIPSAELIKYSSNAFLATKIAFINEIADMCEKTGANIDLVSKGMGMDSRIGPDYLKVGPGFGGSCFPKDTMALVSMAKQNGSSAKIVDSVIKSNEKRKIDMAEKVIAAFDGDVRGKSIAVLGLTFKANTDDMRDSASLIIIPELLKKGAILKLYDPEGMPQAKKILDDFNSNKELLWCDSAQEAVADSDAVVIVTEWNEFINIDLGWLKGQLKQPLLIDLRNLFSISEMKTLGFKYISLGRN